jgi:hypothetical protein
LPIQPKNSAISTGENADGDPGCHAIQGQQHDLACPTDANDGTARKGQFPELSNPGLVGSCDEAAN